MGSAMLQKEERRQGMKHQIEISECKRDCFCKDCDNIRCLHHGKREADCPKYMCDMANKFDCDNCKWLDEWYKEMRKGTEDAVH